MDFEHQIVVGRRQPKGSEVEGYFRIRDPAISGRHCVLRQADGRFYIRDVSTNGTRVDGRRLVPNVEVEIEPGARIEVAQNHVLVLEAEQVAPQMELDRDDEDGSTRLIVNTETEVTVLVGDIAGYTPLNQQFSASEVAIPVKNVLAEIERVVNSFHGTIKEYQGDAIFAFWELDDAAPDWHAIQACHCALALQARVLALAEDETIWTLKGRYPLKMEWALTTGNVLITTIGGDRPVGLAMVGDAVNYAFRLEKLADAERGTVLVCKQTHSRTSDLFEYRGIGRHEVKGRTGAEEVFSLLDTSVGCEPAETVAMTAARESVPDNISPSKPSGDERT